MQVMQIIQETQVIHVMQDWNRVLVSLISWPGQLLSLFSCERLKFLARMLFLGILYWFRKSLPRSIYSISILLLEFIFPFVRPSEYIIIPEVCAQGWYCLAPRCYLQNLGILSTHFSLYFPHIFLHTFLTFMHFFGKFTIFFVEFTRFL